MWYAVIIPTCIAWLRNGCIFSVAQSSTMCISPPFLISFSKGLQWEDRIKCFLSCRITVLTLKNIRSEVVYLRPFYLKSSSMGSCRTCILTSDCVGDFNNSCKRTSPWLSSYNIVYDFHPNCSISVTYA